MNFKYYDLLSSLVTGVIVCISINYAFELNFDYDAIPLLAIAYIVGYFINSISALCENTFYKIMGGMPSDVLLTPIEGISYTGYKRIKFYQPDRVIELLKDELHDQNPSKGKMFGKAMSYSNSDSSTRVPDFNAQYAFSRALLTTVIILGVIWGFQLYNELWYWFILIILLYLSYRRCKERGYYYAREVLIEYLHNKEIEKKNTLIH